MMDNLDAVLAAITNFHFLRPQWLLAILPIGALLVFYQRQQRASWRWREHIAAHILPHLILSSEGNSGLNPYRLAIMMMLCFSLAMAGPSWQKVASPVSADKAPLVIAVNLSASSLADDVQPSRLAAAKLKIRDLLALRPDAPTALLAYAGSAHTVLPLTNDKDLLIYYLDELAPDVMPMEGRDAAAAIELGEKLLSEAGDSGTVLLVTDGIDSDGDEAAQPNPNTMQQQLAVWVFGTETGFADNIDDKTVDTAVDYAALKRFSDRFDARLTPYSVDDSDINNLYRSIRQHHNSARAGDDSLQDEDAGYYLVWPAALLVLLWFRRGMVMQWG